MNPEKSDSDRPPRLTDVAAQAGVSLATVSRVVNHTAQVSQATRQRVEAAMTTLGYVPTAPRPHDEKSALQPVALLIPDIQNPYFAEIVRGVEDEIELEGLSLLLFHTAEDTEREERTLRRLADERLAGVIVFGSRLPSPALVRFQRKSGLPLVVINRRIDNETIACVVVDSEQATWRATRYLVNLGHRRIAYLAGPSASESSLARQRGIEKALAEVGAVLPEQWRVPGFPDIEGGFQAMTTLLGNGRPPTAVLLYNDLMALGALHAIRSRGLRVPEDISLIGFDDITMAAHANPPLTTITQPKHRMGRLAVQQLMHMRRGEHKPGEGYLLLESPLVIRESTAPPPGE